MSHLKTAFPKDHIITNSELVNHIMDFSEHGGLAQIVIVTALERYAQRIVDTPDAEMDELFSTTPFRSSSWKDVCREILEKLDERIVHNQQAREWAEDRPIQE